MLKETWKMTGENATYKVGGVTILRNQGSTDPKNDGWLLTDENYTHFHVHPSIVLALLVGARKLGTLEKL
jgi:hypothetical protein